MDRGSHAAQAIILAISGCLTTLRYLPRLQCQSFLLPFPVDPSLAEDTLLPSEHQGLAYNSWPLAILLQRYCRSYLLLRDPYPQIYMKLLAKASPQMTLSCLLYCFPLYTFSLTTQKPPTPKIMHKLSSVKQKVLTFV